MLSTKRSSRARVGKGRLGRETHRAFLGLFEKPVEKAVSGQALFDVIDTGAGDGETAVFGLAQEAFVFQIPPGKQKVLPRRDHHVFQLKQTMQAHPD